MGFFVDPVKLPVNGMEFGGIFISWDGVDSPVVSIRELATEICLDGRKLAGEVLLHDTNEPALKQIVDKHVAPFLEQRRKEFANSVLSQAKFLFEDENENGIPDGMEPVGNYAQARTALDMGAQFLDWTIDFSKISGIGTRFRMNKAVWDRCRGTQSALSMKDRDAVRRYQQAFEAMAPELDKLTRAIDEADAAAKQWREGAGAEALTALSLLAVTHEMVAVYTQQDYKAIRMSARTRELARVVGEEVSADATRAMLPQINEIEKLYRDADFNEKLFDYLAVWDPSIVYYFHAVAARATGADRKNLKGFDSRLFKTLVRGAELLNQKEAHTVDAAEEFQTAVDAVWEAAVEKGIAAKSPSVIESKRDELLTQLLAEPSAGWLTTLAVWSGMVMTYTGNMEGPPSIASMVLSTYSRTQHFIDALNGREGLLRLVVMWGVDPVEHKVILNLVKSDVEKARELGRKIFNNGSWRSPGVFAAFYVFSAAVLVYHLHELGSKFASGEGDGFFDDEVLKLALPVMQDLLGFALIGFTNFYSKQMTGYLKNSGFARLDELSETVETLETKTFPAKAARVAHVSLSAIGLGLAIWTFADETPTADQFEDWMLGLTVGAAGVSLLGVVVGGSLAFLGPVGFVAGVLIGLITAAYVRWFQSTMTKAMKGVGKLLLDDPYLKSKKNIVAEHTVFLLFFEGTLSLEQVLEETVEQLTEFDWEDKLQKKFIIDYSRAGLPPKMIADLYVMDESEVKRRLKEARATATRRKRAAVVTDIHLVPPLTPNIVLRVGAVTDVALEVTHGSGDALPTRMWLEVALDKPNDFLADGTREPKTTYNDSTQVVMLRTSSTTAFGRIYRGTFRLNKRPDDGKLSLLAFTPVDKFATGPTSGAAALATKPLEFEVEPEATP